MSLSLLEMHSGYQHCRILQDRFFITAFCFFLFFSFNTFSLGFFLHTNSMVDLTYDTSIPLTGHSALYYVLP